MNRGLVGKFVAAAVATVAVAALAPAAQAASSPRSLTSPWKTSAGRLHVMRPVKAVPGAGPTQRATTTATSLTNGTGQLVYGGAPVQDQPAVYLDFWGAAWNTGFTDAAGYTSGQAQTYIKSFLDSLGGSRWFSSQTEYCAQINKGLTSSSCTSGVTHVGTPGGVPLANIWNDTATQAVVASDASVAAEADNAATHFGLNQNVEATVFVLTPMNQSYFSSQGVGFCGYHGVRPTVLYAYIPWLPDAPSNGAACGVNAVNPPATNDAFGHGHFDGFSIVVGHELAEAATDPFVGQGWVDATGLETGDKCQALTAWPATNVAFAPSIFFAVQPLWTDAGASCATEDLGFQTAAHVAVAAQDANHRDVFFHGSDGALWQSSWSGAGWGAPQSLGGGVVSGPAAASWGPGHLDVFVRGTDNALWHRAWNGSSWAAWEPLDGALSAGPAAVSWAPNRLDVFVRGTDNTLWHRAWNGSSWAAWEPLGGVLTSDPTVASWSAGRLDIFVRGGDNALWHMAWTGSAWSGWQSLGGRLAGGPSALSTAPGTLEVFGLGTDNNALWRQVWNGSIWTGWSSLEGSWSQDPASLSPPSTGSIELYMVGFTSTPERLPLGI